MPPRLSRDPVHLGCALAVVAVALGFLVARPWIDNELLRIRPLSAVLSLLLSLGLLLRARGGSRGPKMLIGILVAGLCGLQLFWFLVGGPVDAVAADGRAVGQTFAAGLFCLGAAIILDGVLPARWGRHLVFGLIGAVVAGMGVFGLLEFVGLRRDLGLASVDIPVSMRLPSALVLLFGGVALLAGARLRGASIETAGAAGIHPGNVRDRTGLAAGLAMLFITLGATGLVWRETKMQDHSREMMRSEQALQRFAEALQGRALAVGPLLDGLRGLFAASHSLSAAEWSAYLHHLHDQGRRPGSVAVLYAREWLPDMAAGESPTIDVDGVAYAIRPAGRRDRHVVVSYVSPDTAIMRRLIGIDIAAEPDYRDVLEVARGGDTGAVSAPVAFARHGDPLGRTGFAVVRSVTGGDGTAGGFVYAMVDMAAIVELALKDAGTSFSLRIRDLDADEGADLLHASTDFRGEGTFLSTMIEPGGRRWQIDALPRAAATGDADSRMAALVVAGGSLAALALFAITWVLAGHRARALDLASRMTAELRRSQREQQAIAHTANAGIVTTDDDGRIIYANPAVAEIFGYAPEAMPGLGLTDLVPERYREQHRLGIERAARGESPNIIGRSIETIGLHADGSEFPIEILASAWSSDGQAYFTGFLRDISERKRQEQMLLQKTRELERSNAELEQFAYVASHDLQEPLRMVASYVQLLARRYRGRLDADADEFIGFAVDGATRMQQLIQDLLAYARVGRSGKQPIPVHIGHCAQSACAALQEGIVESGARVEIVADGIALAVPSQLTQLFQNLVANAIKFRGDAHPEIRIDARRDGAFWEVRVADNGIGIEPQHRERVFAIFQRLHTRREYPGTGIGLAICRKIVEGFGGSIRVESEPGRGSTFHFTVPASEKPA